jgi:ElaB/YqjD/DUF883 family membrane-anchored ribosome-binding protein
MARTKATPEESARRDPEQIEAEIAETREELADTVGAVADKADVKKQAKRKAGEAKVKAKAKVDQAKEAVQEKTDELAAKAASATPESRTAAAERTQDIAGRAREYARANPVRAAAVGAFVAGIVIGRALARD